MGFRNPITTATALDTGAQANRTSVYVDPANGLVGFRGFLGGDSDSTIQRQFLRPGGRFRFDSGSFAQGDGVPRVGPVLDFEVTGSLPYTRTLRLASADAVDLGGASLGGVKGDQDWTALTPATGWTSPGGALQYKVRAGWVTIAIYASNAAGWARNTACAALPTAIAPGKDVGTMCIWGGVVREVHVTPIGGVPVGASIVVVDAGSAGNGVSGTVTYPIP